MATTTNLGKVHVFSTEALYNQYKSLISDNDLALLKDDSAAIVAANLAENGYVKFANGLIVQWGTGQNITFTEAKYATPQSSNTQTIAFPVTFLTCYKVFVSYLFVSGQTASTANGYAAISASKFVLTTVTQQDANGSTTVTPFYFAVGIA